MIRELTILFTEMEYHNANTFTLYKEYLNEF